MALVSHKTVKYPEILSAVRGKVTSGASSVVSGRTRIPIASANTLGVTTSWYYYNSASAPGYQVTAVTTTYIEVTGTPTAVASGKAVIFGLPTTVTAGMSSFYLRLGANIYADDPIFFSKESASEGYKVQSVQNTTTALVKITPAIATGSQAIGSTLVYIGGIAVNTSDTVRLTDTPSKPAVANQNSFSLSETTDAFRRVTAATTNSFSLGQSINTTQSVRTTDTFTLADSTRGRARKQIINVSDSFSFGDVNRRNLIVNLSDAWLFSDTAILPNLGFTTPEVKVVPPFLPETTGQAKMLFRHYANRERHVNVYMLLDGTFVQDYPSPENGNTNIPYPWNPSDPTAPYSTVTNWDGTIQRYYLPNPIVRVFYGGETTMVTQDLANQLRRAGYGNYIRTV